MKLFTAIMKYDYGEETRGYSFEYFNVYLPLCDVYGKENILLFDYFGEFKKNGKNAMNNKLLETIAAEKPDISIFCILWENQFDENVVSSLRNYTRTVIYFFDDPWRQRFVRHWIKYFDFFTTPDYYMLKQYELEEIKNVIYSPFGYNSSIYKKLNLDKIYDVSFVGGYSPLRKWVIRLLEKEGIKVNVFGRGWGKKGKWISQEEMIDVFNRSKINLNLSNAIYNDARFLIWSLHSLENVKQVLLLKKHKEQVKGRHYEINACGGFQLSYYIPGLNMVYEIDKEIAVYESIENIAPIVKFFLEAEGLRNTIAENGYKRSVKEHSAQAYLTRTVDYIIKDKK